MKSYKEFKAKLSFENQDPLNREASKIEFETPSDMDIYEFKIMCIRLAHAIGYHEKSIERAFGEIKDNKSTTELNLMEFFNTINGNIDEE